MHTVWCCCSTFSTTGTTHRHFHFLSLGQIWITFSVRNKIRNCTTTKEIRIINHKVPNLVSVVVLWARFFLYGAFTSGSLLWEDNNMYEISRSQYTCTDGDGNKLVATRIITCITGLSHTHTHSLAFTRSSKVKRRINIGLTQGATTKNER